MNSDHKLCYYYHLGGELLSSWDNNIANREFNQGNIRPTVHVCIEQKD